MKAFYVQKRGEKYPVLGVATMAEAMRAVPAADHPFIVETEETVCIDPATGKVAFASGLENLGRAVPACFGPRLANVSARPMPESPAPPACPYSLADLEKAKAERARVREAWANYSGNNPDKYHGDLNDTQRRVEIVEDALKAAGILPLTDQEILDRELDRRFPDAASKTIVEHEGARYQLRFTPAEKSRRGNVMRWHRRWVRLSA